MGRIEIDLKVMHGKPVIKGTRIPADVILGSLAGGMTYEEIEKEYGVTKKDILAVIEYAASIISHEKVKPLKMKA
ncbi:MAG: DUF433 domain-containing protein [Candidatus Aenigmarchaeota archaeon]|nr:DUF433 domain-containing protein [Candidatus Aenigmarchaeota archaeon]